MKSKPTYAKKIVLQSRSGYRPELDALIEAFMHDDVRFVGVVGTDCEKIEDIIYELCIGDGTSPHFMLTTSHPGESPDEAMEFGRSVRRALSSEVQLVEF